MRKLSWLISLAISLIGFLFIGAMFATKPDEATNSGNFGFVGLIFLAPFILLSLFTTYRYFLTITLESTDWIFKLFGMIGGILLIGIIIYLFNDFKIDTLIALGEPYANRYDHLWSIPKLNEHTYSLYFNFYTYMLIHSAAGLLGALFALIQPKKKLLDKIE